jgi:hypothetical protein
MRFKLKSIKHQFFNIKFVLIYNYGLKKRGRIARHTSRADNTTFRPKWSMSIVNKTHGFFWRQRLKVLATEKGDVLMPLANL